jgi:CMP-N-acetylneuraminic acid synthetase
MILGVTLARGGSKGIKRKNIVPCAGKPLIAWTIEAAKKSKFIDRYIVSTENAEIEKVAKQYGAEVVARPTELALDHTNRWKVLRHIVSTVPCDHLVLLQATSPVRKPGLIDSCIEEYLDGGYDTLATGFEIRALGFPANEGKHRQDTSPLFEDDGNVYIWNADLIKRDIYAGKRVKKLVISQPENVDINDEFGLWVAGRILNENLVCQAQ